MCNRVLITGIAGKIGRILHGSLCEHYEVSGIDVRRAADIDSRRVDMRRLRSIQPAFDGKDVVIALAANADASAGWKTVHENNVPATVNAFEAARRAGVRRVIFASSNHAVGMYEREEPYASIVTGRYAGLDPDRIPRLDAAAPVRPDGPYGVGKVLGEATARFYAEEYEISTICLRIGTVTRHGGPQTVRHFATLLTHHDLARLVHACIDAPDKVRFGIFYGVSANTWRFWDLEEARVAIGYAPADNAEAWR